MTQPAEEAFGLDVRARTLLRDVLRRYPRVSDARVFGSRAMGNYRPESDVDLALYGEVDEQLAARIAGELDELPLPYSFDVCAYPCLRPGPLREHIDRVGRSLASSIPADRSGA